MKKAKLIPVWMEVRGRGARYRWVEGRKIITPEGRELQPHMRTRAAKKFCKELKWICVEAKE